MKNVLIQGIADLQARGVGVLVGAVVATAVLELMMKVGAPKMLGIAPMNPADLLTAILGLEPGHVVGRVLHLGIALVGFPIGYMLFAFRPFPGPHIVKGVLWGVLLWIVAMVVIVPLAGQPLFFGGGKPMMAALAAHVVYGVVLAAIVGRPD